MYSSEIGPSAYFQPVCTLSNLSTSSTTVGQWLCEHLNSDVTKVSCNLHIKKQTKQQLRIFQ